MMKSVEFAEGPREPGIGWIAAWAARNVAKYSATAPEHLLRRVL